MGKRLIDNAKIAAAQIGFQTVFNNALKWAEEPIVQLSMPITSTGSEEQYKWFGSVPGMEQWLDDRKMSSLRAESQTIANLDWANGLRVDKNDILDDKLGMVEPRIRTLADIASRHPGKMLADLLVNGFDGTVVGWSDGKSYDGKYFFAADHVEGDSTGLDNVGTPALAYDDYSAARVEMMSLTDESGDYPLDIEPNLLVVGPSNERTALEIVKAGLRNPASDAASIDNVYKGSADVIVSKRLVGSYANYWFMADTTKPIKPLVFQTRERPTFVASEANMFARKEMQYGVDGRYAAGYGFWQLAWGSNGTT